MNNIIEFLKKIFKIENNKNIENKVLDDILVKESKETNKNIESKETNKNIESKETKDNNTKETNKNIESKETNIKIEENFEDIIKQMITILFPQTSKENISVSSNYIAQFGKKTGLNTTLRVAHFLAQVREEIGPKFGPKNESFNYSYYNAINIFKSISKEDALKYARNYQNNYTANEQMLANIVYANKLGNGDKSTGDGWRFRGKGILQITGRYNYSEVQKRIDKYCPDANVDIMDANVSNSLKGSVLMGIGYWIYKDLYKKADLGKTNNAVDAVTSIINKYTNSYQNRKKHFNDIKHLI